MPNTSRTVTLTVKSARADDVYKDISRVGRDDRDGLRTGRVHAFRVNGVSHSMILRGVTKKEQGFVLIDEALRDKLGVQYGQSYTFEIAELGFWAELFWGWNATDPAYRASSRGALIGVALGFLSLLLGAVGVWLGWLSLHGC